MSKQANVCREFFTERPESVPWRQINRLLPRNLLGDRLSSPVRFLRVHRRLPQRGRRQFSMLFQLKTFDEILDPLRVLTSDRELVKLYVRAKFGEAHDVAMSAVLGSAMRCARFDFSPGRVIRPSYFSVPMILPCSVEPLDRDAIVGWLKKNCCRSSREATCRRLRPKVIVEPFTLGQQGRLRDLLRKQLTRNDSARQRSAMFQTRNFYESAWRPAAVLDDLPGRRRGASAPAELGAHARVGAAVKRRLWLVRVDLYSNAEQAVVGELTHAQGSVRDYNFVPADLERTATELLLGR